MTEIFSVVGSLISFFGTEHNLHVQFLTMAALVSPQKGHVQHPVTELRRAWNASTKKEKEEFDLGPWREVFESFFDLLSNSGCCVDMYNPRLTTRCTCMQQLDFADEEEQEAVFNYPSKYAILPWGEQ
jgi:hypothetical protein